MLNSDRDMPRLIWVAAKPPIPPFAGGTLKTDCGLRLLAGATEIDLVTYAEPGETEAVRESFCRYWGDAPFRLHLLEYAPKPSMNQAWSQKRFQFSGTLDRPELHQTLERLNWQRPDRLLIFDDIAFAPLIARYGSNTLFSPHDCISQMFRSYLSGATSPPERLKLWMQARIARHYETRFYEHALLVHVVTERDRLWLQEINPRARYHTCAYRDFTSQTPERAAQPTCDVLIWADLRIAGQVRGTQEFLRALRVGQPANCPYTVSVVGRVDGARARTLLGAEWMGFVDYSARLEAETGIPRQGKITVIPDIGGAGFKSRCGHLLAQGLCLACLYSQMEGLEGIADLGAINARTLSELARTVLSTLQKGEYETIAQAGATLYARAFRRERLEESWHEMIARAVRLRDQQGR